MKKRSHLTDEDRALWKHATSVIEPHSKTSKHQKKRKFKEDAEPASAPTKHAPIHKPKWKPLAHTPVAKPVVKKAASELPSIATDVFAGIKSKKRKIDARLDLHGLTQDAAHKKAVQFIQHSHARHLKTVLIITGKGSNAGPVATSSSDGAEASHQHKGVLQKNLSRWLSAHECAKHIAGITQAPRELGGAGAFIITLKKH